MKLYNKKRPYGDSAYYCRKYGFKFILDLDHDNGWYVVASHSKKGIRFNTLWGNNISLKTLEDATKFCENFNYKDYKCLGSDINK